MTAMPLGEFTAEQASRVAEFDAAVEPAEVTREKLRLAEEALARVLDFADALKRGDIGDPGRGVVAWMIRVAVRNTTAVDGA